MNADIIRELLAALGLPGASESIKLDSLAAAVTRHLARLGSAAEAALLDAGRILGGTAGQLVPPIDDQFAVNDSGNGNSSYHPPALPRLRFATAGLHDSLLRLQRICGPITTGFTAGLRLSPYNASEEGAPAAQSGQDRATLTGQSTAVWLNRLNRPLFVPGFVRTTEQPAGPTGRAIITGTISGEGSVITARKNPVTTNPARPRLSDLYPGGVRQISKGLSPSDSGAGRVFADNAALAISVIAGHAFGSYRAADSSQIAADANPVAAGTANYQQKTAFDQGRVTANPDAERDASSGFGMLLAGIDAGIRRLVQPVRAKGTGSNPQLPGTNNPGGVDAMQSLGRQLQLSPAALINITDRRLSTALMNSLGRDENGGKPYPNTLLLTPVPAAAPVTLNQTTHITVNGSDAPRETASRIADRQTGINATLAQQLSPKAR